MLGVWEIDADRLDMAGSIILLFILAQIIQIYWSISAIWLLRGWHLVGRLLWLVVRVGLLRCVGLILVHLLVLPLLCVDLLIRHAEVRSQRVTRNVSLLRVCRVHKHSLLPQSASMDCHDEQDDEQQKEESRDAPATHCPSVVTALIPVEIVAMRTVSRLAVDQPVHVSVG